jgi:aspartate aminotransferase-like enzyme
MFGPNKVILAEVFNSSTHRSNNFKKLYKDVVSAFRRKWEILNDFEILFIPGSGTVGVEAVVRSVKAPIDFPTYNGRFSEKWRAMTSLYNTDKDYNLKKIGFEVQFETSLSKLNIFENISIVDGISSFPYFDIPNGTDFFITCSNKQLGSLVGLSIVFIRKSRIDLLKPTDVSYLNLSNYLERGSQGQTPTTFPEFQLNYLLTIIENFNLKKHRENIDKTSKLILDFVPKEFIVGDLMYSPCISVKKNFFKENFGAQLYNNDYSDTYQLFTYSHQYDDYKTFINSINYEK